MFNKLIDLLASAVNELIIRQDIVDRFLSLGKIMRFS